MSLLSDPPMILYYVFAFACLIAAFLFLQNKTKRRMIGLGVCLALLVLVAVVDYTTESPREAINRTLQEIAQATREKRLDDCFTRFSNGMQYNGRDKAALDAKAREAFQRFDWKGANIWDNVRDDFLQADETHASQGFLVKLSDTPSILFYCRAKFRKEADGKWRCEGFAMYDAMQRDRGPEVGVPGV